MMDIYYMIVLFILGTIFGSFYNVVGDRVPTGKSIIKPSSYCPKCGHTLTPLELIPIVSFLIQGGKCKSCRVNIPLMHPLFEFASGLLFALAYLAFGPTFELLIALTFISILLIVFVSDFQYMIIPDEVLIIGGLFLFVEVFILKGMTNFLWSLLDGVIAFGLMFLLKLFGDFLFKKESMGGGDIKLLFLFGFILGWEMSLFAIFLGSFVGLPISFIMLHKRTSHEIAFGPFLSIGAVLVLLLRLDLDKLIKLLMFNK